MQVESINDNKSNEEFNNILNNKDKNKDFKLFSYLTKLITFLKNILIVLYFYYNNFSNLIINIYDKLITELSNIKKFLNNNEEYIYNYDEITNSEIFKDFSNKTEIINCQSIQNSLTSYDDINDNNFNNSFNDFNNFANQLIIDNKSLNFAIDTSLCILKNFINQFKNNNTKSNSIENNNYKSNKIFLNKHQKNEYSEIDLYNYNNYDKKEYIPDNFNENDSDNNSIHDINYDSDDLSSNSSLSVTSTSTYSNNSNSDSNNSNSDSNNSISDTQHQTIVNSNELCLKSINNLEKIIENNIPKKYINHIKNKLYQSEFSEVLTELEELNKNELDNLTLKLFRSIIDIINNLGLNDDKLKNSFINLLYKKPHKKFNFEFETESESEFEIEFESEFKTESESESESELEIESEPELKDNMKDDNNIEYKYDERLNNKSKKIKISKNLNYDIDFDSNLIADYSNDTEIYNKYLKKYGCIKNDDIVIKDILNIMDNIKI